MGFLQGRHNKNVSPLQNQICMWVKYLDKHFFLFLFEYMDNIHMVNQPTYSNTNAYKGMIKKNSKDFDKRE